MPKFNFHVSEYLDIDELTDLVEEGFISERKHRDLPLTIYNYTPKATYNFRPEEWPEALVKSRGLILGHEGFIVGLAQPKFWNLDPENHNEDNSEFIVYDKLDGSLGIVYAYNNHIGVATRGSFHSDQAEWATNFVNQHEEYANFFIDRINMGHTPHVEIIYKQNRIVVDYDFEDLVLLGEENAVFYDGWLTGWNWPEGWSDDYPGRVAQRYYSDSWKDFLRADRDNAEGYVIYYPKSGNKYKIKHEHYMQLHKLIFNITPKNIWEQMSSGNGVAFMQSIPEEFREDAEGIYRQIEWEYTVCYRTMMDEFHKLNAPGITRKEFALKLSEYPKVVHKYMFALLDGNTKGFKKMIWQDVKP